MGDGCTWISHLVISGTIDGLQPMTAGEQLGPYRIEAPIGEGGMGTVYRARDTRLDRTVALKVAKHEFSERFEREARAVAAFNHPHICTLHDVGPNYLVMEYVDGTPLKGPLPVAQAVEYAGQILDALDAAHRKGITHRDLKPANVMVTKQGIKLLDFGLAKQNAVQLKETDATLVAPLTGEGQIVGTLQYMAPEQLQGGEADARSDLFAFGCVLYEMLSGKRAFGGSSQASVIAAILEREPEPLNLAPPLDRVIRKCLAKDPDKRFQNAQDLKTALEWAVEQAPVAVAAKPKRWWWIAGAALVSGLVLGAGWMHFGKPGIEKQPIRLQINPPEGATFTRYEGASISPDGKTVAFIAIAAGKTSLWVRLLDGVSAKKLPGTEGVLDTFWSPDSKSLGFYAEGKLLRIGASGGAVQDICVASNFGGGAWGTDGQILFSSRQLYSVPASGGVPSRLTALDTKLGESSHIRPQILPKGRFLFWVLAAQPEKSGAYVSSFANPEERIFLAASRSSALYSSGENGGPSYLLWQRGTALLAQRIDETAWKLAGEVETVADPVSRRAPGRLHASLSANGLLLHASLDGGARLTWFDRTGKPLGEPAETEPLVQASLSADNLRAAVVRANSGEGYDIWLRELERRSSTRLTIDAGYHGFPIWAPDGRGLVYEGGSPRNLIYLPIDRAGGKVQINHSPNRQIASDWSKDGRYILYREVSSETGLDIWVLPVGPNGTPDSNAKPWPYLKTEFDEREAVFFPGPQPQWVAYVSDETGQPEIYVGEFPQQRGKLRISTRGGQFPRWPTSGKELFYLSPDNRLMVVDLNMGAGTIKPSTPRELFPLPPYTSNTFNSPYEAASDGKRFLVLASVENGTSPLTVIVNWRELLKKDGFEK